jgi:hypothetical protein
VQLKVRCLGEVVPKSSRVPGQIFFLSAASLRVVASSLGIGQPGNGTDRPQQSRRSRSRSRIHLKNPHTLTPWGHITLRTLTNPANRKSWILLGSKQKAQVTRIFRSACLPVCPSDFKHPVRPNRSMTIDEKSHYRESTTLL